MKELQIFKNQEFGQVRVLEKDGEPWFVAKDVCEILEIKNTTDALKRLDNDEVTRLNLGGLSGDSNLVNEYGLYSLVLGSRKKEAKKFKRWITHEVIPSIRKHGAYMTTETIEKTLNDPDFIIGLATKLKEEQERNKMLQDKIVEDKPFTNFGKSIAHSSDCITIGEFAKVLRNKGINIGRNRLFDWLRDNSFLIKTGRERNNPQQRYVEQGLFQIKESVIHAIDGDMVRTTTLLTGKGQMYFLNKLQQIAS
ncbi:phage antirepressor KilAC domain-containing protein [Anaerovirgula multivorans]|nr:phage antirepressor [Anaerovirgula multivorans]